jgi:AraC-like DNA-binding protein
MCASSVEQCEYSKPLPLEIRIRRDVTLTACQARRRMVTERRAWTEEPDACAPSFLEASTLNCHQLAEIFAFFFDKTLLRAGAIIRSATGEVVWIRPYEDTQSDNVLARPALVVYGANGALSEDRAETVLDVAGGDPLLEHVALVLELALKANTPDTHLYAELLADALAVHFLKRYATVTNRKRHSKAGLPFYKLKRVFSYVNEHLEQDLSLYRLAGVAQTSVAHFARSFKQAAGASPHHYVLACRIERAKELLMESDLPLSMVAQRVGFADQSHLTAVFRTLAATTPQAYRVSTKSK